MEKVSIIVPVYNSERYLGNCLDTLLNQTYKNIEVILINDGSKDKSLQICKEYEAKDDRIKLFSIPNSGVSTARNLGIDNATGDFITFVDSDDWIELNSIQFGVEKAKSSNADVIIWSYFKNFPGEERILSLLPNGDQTFEKDKDLLYLKSIYQFYGQEKLGDTVSAGTTWGKFYKSNLIKDNNIKFKKELTRSQDVIFGLEAFSKAKVIKYFDVPLYHYRINNSSTCSGTRFIEDTQTPFNSLLKEMTMFSNQFNNREKYDEVLHARSVQVILWHIEHKYFHENNKDSIYLKKKHIIELISKEPYSTAINKVNLKLLPKKERTMTKLFRKNAIISFYLIYKIHLIYTNIKNKKYE